jgi:hypothetical protein
MDIIHHIGFSQTHFGSWNEVVSICGLAGSKGSSWMETFPPLFLPDDGNIQFPKCVWEKWMSLRWWKISIIIVMFVLKYIIRQYGKSD